MKKESGMKRTALEYKKIYESPDFHREYLYEGKLGFFYENAENVFQENAFRKGASRESVFRIWSPFAKQAQLRLFRDGSGGEPFAAFPMKRLEKGVWEYRAAEDLHGIYYDFILELDGERVQTTDPYAKACGINGKRSMAADLRRTDPEGWEGDLAPENGPEQVIWETHVKEFSWDPAGGFPEEVRGKYRAFCCEDTTLRGNSVHPTGLSYLKELGVTHVQLMPVYDYGSVDEAGDPAQFNWGYDPMNWNVPEGSYSSDPAHGEVRIRELKEAVQSLHRQGFRVIMDVVYNHTYSLETALQKTAPWYYYRVKEDGTVSNGSACGNDIASERPMCAKLILESVLYWAEEYHMDGFRFDLMGLLDVELMNRIRAALDERFGKGEKLVYGEPWAAGYTAMEKGFRQAVKNNVRHLDENIGIFSDRTRDAVRGSVFRLKEPGFVNGAQGMEGAILNSAKAWQGSRGARMLAPSQTITYISAHDNQTLWDKLAETTPDEEERRRQYRLAAGIYLTCQGRLFFLSGEEAARTKGGLEDSYNASIEINRLDWERAWRERELVDYYRGLIALRKQLPGLCDKSPQAEGRIRTAWKRKGFAGFYVDNRRDGEDSPWKTLCILYNRRKKPVRVPLEGDGWEALADGRDSFLWKKPERVRKEAQVEAVSILVLGKREK